MKKIYIYLIVGIAILGLGVGGFFAVRYINATNATASTYVSLAVNPEVEFTVNARENVISVNATDAEGDEIVQGYDFVGLKIDEACKIFTDLCTQAGYLDLDADEDTVDTNDVIITVVNSDETTEDNLYAKIRNKVHSYFQNNGIFGRVSQDTLDEYLDEAVEYEMSVGHIKLVMRALELNLELTFEDVKDMQMNEILAMTKTMQQHMKKMTHQIRNEVKTELQELKQSETYTDMFALIDEIKTIEEQLEEDELTEEQITALEAQLEVKKDDFEESYSDLYEEYEESKEDIIEAAKEDAEALLEQAKSQYEEKIESHRAQMEAHRQSSRSILNALKTRIQNWQEEMAD